MSDELGGAGSRGPSSGHEDYGFFGPHSVTWRVWRYPTSLTVGFQRAVTIEQLDPFLLAAVRATNKVYSQPRIRYNRTLRYFATVAFGDTRSAVHASRMLVKVHAKAGVGIEPISGRRYDANDPKLQLWIHMTAWHSILYAYETYGPGRLSEIDEDRYWHECATAAALQTIDPDMVPRSRAEVRRYFEHERLRLAASESTQVMMHRILGALYDVIAESRPRSWVPLAWTAAATVRMATIATMPRWQRELAGVRQSRITDVAIRPVLRFVFGLVAASRASEMRWLRILSPVILPVMEPVIRGIAPARPVTLTPAQAFRRYGLSTPREIHTGLAENTGAVLFVRHHRSGWRDGAHATPAGAGADEALVVHYHRTQPERRHLQLLDGAHKLPSWGSTGGLSTTAGRSAPLDQGRAREDP